MRPPLSARRLVLVPAGSSAESEGRPLVRRYRVARLQFDRPQTPAPKRFDYLKRTFD